MEQPADFDFHCSEKESQISGYLQHFRDDVGFLVLSHPYVRTHRDELDENDSVQTNL
jgi:hypothetical protein